MKVFTCLTITLAVILTLSYVIALPVLYGIFSFAGYEDWECYASQDSSSTVPWDLALGDPPSDYHDVSGNFNMVNLWGFINFAVAIGIGCCGGCFAIM